MKIIITIVALAVIAIVYFGYKTYFLNKSSENEGAQSESGQTIELTAEQKNDYLKKIRAHLSTLDPEAFAPADPEKYKINSAEKILHNGVPAIAVYLDCCYLGDIAYFDAATSEIIDFKAGAK